MMIMAVFAENPSSSFRSTSWLMTPTEQIWKSPVVTATIQVIGRVSSFFTVQPPSSSSSLTMYSS